MKKINTLTYLSSLAFYIITGIILAVFWIINLNSPNSINWYFYLGFELLIPGFLGIIMIIFTILKIRKDRKTNPYIQTFSKENFPWNLLFVYNNMSFSFVFLRFTIFRFFQVGNFNNNWLFTLLEMSFLIGIIIVTIFFPVFLLQKNIKKETNFLNDDEINSDLLQKFQKMSKIQMITCWIFAIYNLASSWFFLLIFFSDDPFRYSDIIIFAIINFGIPLILGLIVVFFSIRKLIFARNNKNKVFWNLLNWSSSIWIIFCFCFLFIYFAFPLQNVSRNSIAFVIFMNLQYILPCIASELSRASYKAIKESNTKYNEIKRIEDKAK